ncbi:MAG: hypothetical protein U0168_26665 [Nannocystaceae bacterium]
MHWDARAASRKLAGMAGAARNRRCDDHLAASSGCGVVAIAALVLVACRGRDETAAGTPPATTPTAASARSGDAGPVARVAKATTLHMPSHFADVMALHGALLRGDLEQGRTAAAALLAERESVVLAEWAPHLYAMEAAAREVTQSRDVAGASMAAAELAGSCGACHRALGAALDDARALTPPPSDGDTETVMRRHAWAFDRLWEGLVLPSDRAWTAGAAAFVALPECPQPPTEERDDGDIRRARETLQTLEQRAREAQTPEQRVQVYGAMLPTCSGCHAQQQACER